MTTFSRRDDGNRHSYLLNGRTVPGVTSIIGILDKPALVQWAADESAAYADEHWARLSEMRSADRIKEIARARFAANRKSIWRGHRIHRAAEQLAREGSTEVEVAPEYLPGVEAYAKLLDDHGFRSVMVEAPVASTTYQYAGTLDTVVESDRWGRVLLDVKTGKGVYAEVALQLAAYRYADLCLVRDEDGEWREQEMPQVDRCMVAHIRDTTVELVPVDVTPTIYAAFLTLLDVHNLWIRRTSYRHRDDPDYSYPIGQAIFPEDAK